MRPTHDVDLERVLELLHPDVEVGGHDGRVSHGPDEAVASMLGWLREWKSFAAQREEFTDLGGYRALGVVHGPDGQIAGIALYRTREVALEAAGLG